MNIACLGWGSLIWDPRNLPCGTWHNDGPALPIEFGRVSGGGKITLVLTDGPDLVPTLWTCLNVASLDAAVVALQEREDVPNANLSIGRWPGATRDYPGAVAIASWAKERNISAVVWTALKPGMSTDTRGVMPKLDDLLKHVENMDAETCAKTLEYVSKAPDQIRTAFRPHLLSALSELQRKF